ncbi:MAG: hypothetical protein E7055_18650 [Lentisphaerae bacterium]|nr:hypothetical protein [Lentisphaerota bacterium]
MSYKFYQLAVSAIRGILRVTQIPWRWFFRHFSKTGYLVNLIASADPKGEGSTVMLDFYEKNASFLPYAENDYFLKLNTGLEKVAIILQGPVCHRKNFTLETIRRYRGLYPDIRIYLSTWENEIVDFDPETEGFTLVRNPLPKNRGPGNINCQILSTRYGLEAAKRDGCRWAMKTRTDYRFFDWQLPHWYLSLLEEFPVRGNGLKSRIIVQEASRFVPYYLDDYCMFGEISDLEFFWNIPLIDGVLKRKKIFTLHEIDSIKELYEPPECPELYLYRSFAERLGDSSELTCKDYYRFLADRLILTHWDQWLWFKYNNINWIPRRSMNAYMNYMNFSDWLCIYHDSEKYAFDAAAIMNLSPFDRVSASTRVKVEPEEQKS